MQGDLLRTADLIEQGALPDLYSFIATIIITQYYCIGNNK